MSKAKELLSRFFEEKNPYDYQPKDVRSVQLKSLDDKGKVWYGVPSDFPRGVVLVSFHSDSEASMKATLPDHALTWSFFDKNNPVSKKVGYIEGNSNLGTVSFLWDATKINSLKSYIEAKGIKPEYVRSQSSHI